MLTAAEITQLSLRSKRYEIHFMDFNGNIIKVVDSRRDEVDRFEIKLSKLLVKIC